jgi:hypothetical protein
MKKRWQKWTIVELKNFLDDYKSGEPIEVLATKYDRSPNALRQQSAKAHVYRTVEALSRARSEARLGDGSKTGPKRLEYQDG